MKRAIVLAGGGSRGSYQMGFWRAIRELGIDYQIVTGSSVGALNAAVFASGDYDGGIQMWNSITTQDIIETTPSKISQIIDPNMVDAIGASLHGLGDIFEDAVKVKMDSYPLHKLMRNFLSEKEVREGVARLGITVSEYPTLRCQTFTLEEIPYGMMYEYLLASSTVFPAMNPRTIAGKRYVDGGYSDNFPVNLALDMGAEDIIGVALKASGVEAKYSTDYPVRIIKPHFNLGTSMHFDPEMAKRNMVLGYNDTMRSFGMFDGETYTFERGEAQALSAELDAHFADLLCTASCVPLSDKPNFKKTLCVKALAESKKVRFGRMGELFAMTAGETAADIYDVDPLPVYSRTDFGKAVLKAYLPYSETGVEAIEKIFETSKPLTQKLNMLKELDRKDVTAFIVSVWDQLSAGNMRYLKEFHTFNRFSPQEFFAALYISSIKNSGDY